ncbi:hypothetical protein [Pseudoclavibacter sp. 8L]|uniref:hypothetical protein n=1 Tax=Pseudoclavibacter sp. 8L TaxID=2653162 RepID=UPI0013578F1F|nr:hypothetical protein [Pseudoclavibacter sp. 8L]
MAKYLMTVQGIANDIVDDDDETYGFMAGMRWRPQDERNQHPGNARVMEHVVTLSHVYAFWTKWNKGYNESPRGYVNDPNLLKRLEAAIRHYCNLQLVAPDDPAINGGYPEYKDRPGVPSLAATTFGMVAQADTYYALRSRGVAEASRVKLRVSLVRAANWFMNQSASHWNTPIYAFNQVAAGLVGVQRTLQVLNPGTLSWTQADIDERTAFLCANGQAPAGFLHEPYGADFGYNFTVTMPDLAWLHRETGHSSIVPLVQRYVEFMRHAVIREPDTGTLSHVPALHVRNVVRNLDRDPADLQDRGALAKHFLEHVPDIALFFPTLEEKNAARKSFKENPSAVTELDPTKISTSPRTWMYGLLAPDGPPQATRAQVEANLPLLTNDRFTKIEDGSKNDQYLFVRRPSYYAVSVFGDWIETYRSTRQLGTLWNPAMGTVLVGTNDPESPEGWETLGPLSTFSTRQSSSTSQFFDNRTSAAGQINVAAVRSKTGLFSQRTQSVAGLPDYVTGWGYWDQGLRFTFRTQMAGSCTQRLPLLLKNGDTITFSDGTVFVPGNADLEVQATSFVLARGGKRVLFSYGPTARRTLIKRNPSPPPVADIADGTIHRVGVLFETQIDVNIVFLNDVASEPVQAEAHRRGSSEVSLRATVYPASPKAVAELRISGTGVSNTLVLSASGFQVFERTLSQVPAATTALLVAAHASDGSLTGSTTIEIR